MNTKEETFIPNRIARLRNLQTFLNHRLLGQEQACEETSRMIWQGELGLCPEGRPKGSAILLGPTGVGKTELVYALADYLYGPRTHDHLIGYDMANYSHADSLALLTGSHAADAGLWGRDLDRIGDRPAILLFDELEKAHPSVLPLFLAMLDQARLTCADGRSRSLKNHYLFFTSNLASADLVHMQRLPRETMQRKIFENMEARFSPEFCARFTLRVVMSPLSAETLRILTLRCLNEQLEHIQKSFKIQIQRDHPESIESFLHGQVCWQYHQQKLGARLVRQTVHRQLNQALIDYLQTGHFQEQQKLWLYHDHRQLHFQDSQPAVTPRPVISLL